MSTTPLYPHITAPIIGADGNAVILIGITAEALRKGGVPGSERSKFNLEAMSGDYDHVLATIMKWVSVGEVGEVGEDEDED